MTTGDLINHHRSRCSRPPSLTSPTEHFITEQPVDIQRLKNPPEYISRSSPWIPSEMTSSFLPLPRPRLNPDAHRCLQRWSYPPKTNCHDNQGSPPTRSDDKHSQHHLLREPHPLPHVEDLLYTSDDFLIKLQLVPRRTDKARATRLPKNPTATDN